MNRNIFKIALVAGVLLMAMSCNKFLDELPDKRAELNTEEKIKQMLISAYPTEMSTMMFEMMSDNRDDNGPNYSPYNLTVEQAYLLQDISAIDWDVPTRVWQKAYISISSANQVLNAIKDMGSPESLIPTQAEALLCRAFAHFLLVNTFCIAYNPVSSDTDPGIPYVDEPETIVGKKYERKTVKYVYEKINEDIENALPYIRDDYKVVKYHFNRQAAYAFAARFNLFYGEWDNAIKYATEALGENPSRYLRDYDRYSSIPDMDGMTYAYISVEDPANFLIIPQRSMWGRIYRANAQGYVRYGHNRDVTFKTIMTKMPWNDYISGVNAWGNAQCYRYPKIEEIFEITGYNDLGEATGQPHAVLCEFTGDETLFVRAEAYVMKNDLESARKDLNMWFTVAGNTPRNYTVAQIVNFYKNDSGRGTRWDIPEVQSRFTNFEGGDDQLFMFHAVHTLKRTETLYTGMRWLDIKRHGMIIKKRMMKTTTAGDYLIISPYHGATAIQLPLDVITAGLPANVRPALEVVPM